jgi:hypothetical protein
MEAKPETSIVFILMSAIGGLLAFFGFFFGLIGAIAEPGFLYVAIGACSIAVVLFLLAYIGRRRQLNEWKANEKAYEILSKCSYCGLQNDKGTKRCVSCGAPLGPP